MIPLTAAKVAAGVLGAILLIVAIVWIFGGPIFHSLINQIGQEAHAKDVAIDTGKVQAATTAATQDTVHIVLDGSAKIQATGAIHAENTNAIQAAPGASTYLAPELWDAMRRGVCVYPAYDGDIGCSGLQQPDPVSVPPAVQANIPANAVD